MHEVFVFSARGWRDTSRLVGGFTNGSELRGPNISKFLMDEPLDAKN